MSKDKKKSKEIMQPDQQAEVEKLEPDDLTNNSPLATDNYLWLAGCAVVTLIAAFLRFWQLELKPLHHDEGVNGFFLKTLFSEGVYKYDPSNYHGPTLYYIALAFTKVFGLETFAIRASVGVFGVFTVVLVYFLRRYIGTIGSLVAGLLIALSPGMVFISRYFIHEIFFVFCSLGIVLGFLFFIEGRRAGIFAAAWMALLLLVCFLPPALILANAIADDNPTLVFILRVSFFAIEAALVFFAMRFLLEWNEGRPIYLLLATASAALFFATKETAFITLGTMAIACACVWLWRRIYGGAASNEITEDAREPVELSWKTFQTRLSANNDGWLIIGACALVFAYIIVLFFSSFFSYWEGVAGAFKAYAFWTKTGTGEHTQNGTWAYAKWMFKLESPILLLSAVGTLFALARARHRFALFTAFWAYGLFAAYTLIPYKTPWLALSFLLPMCIIAGYGVNELANSRDTLQKGFAALLTTVAVGILGYQTYDLNFQRYDDDKMPYVYAHTRRGFLDLITQIDRYAEKSGKGKDATIEIVSPDYWSMPWYTRNYTHANNFGRLVPASTSEMIVAKKGEQDADITRDYSAHYKYAGTYPLRPGVDLYLLVRRDLADADAKEIPDITSENFGK